MGFGASWIGVSTGRVTPFCVLGIKEQLCSEITGRGSIRRTLGVRNEATLRT